MTIPYHTTRPEVGLRNSESGDMERITDPECPVCGCPQSTVVSQSTWWGKTTVKRACGHCGNQFFATEEAEKAKSVVRFVRVRCPHCQSKNCRITSTRGRIRWHKCGDCQQPFQSVEDGD
jgi:hypothetical protein